MRMKERYEGQQGVLQNYAGDESEYEKVKAAVT